MALPPCTAQHPTLDHPASPLRSMKTTARYLWLAKLAVGLAILGWLFSRLDAPSVWGALRSVDLLWLIPVLAIPHFAILLSSMKWHALVNVAHGHATQGMLFRLYLIGTFFSNFMPSMVGGDVVRVYKLSRAGCDSSIVVASIFLERYLGLAGLVTVLPLAALQPQVTIAIPYFWLLVVAGAFGIASSWAALFGGGSLPISDLETADAAVLVRIRNLIVRSRQRVQSYRGHASVLAYGYMLSILFYLSAGVTVWCATRAVGAAADFWVILSVTPLVLLAGLVPVSVNGLGIIEVGYTWLLTSLGLSLPEAVTVALILRCRALITAGIGGVLFLVDRRTVPAIAAVAPTSPN